MEFHDSSIGFGLGEYEGQMDREYIYPRNEVFPWSTSPHAQELHLASVLELDQVEPNHEYEEQSIENWTPYW